MPADALHIEDYTDERGPHIRIRWTPESTDLHLNLVDLRTGELIASHVNTALDVVITCLTGDGVINVDEESIPLAPGSIVLVPKGSRREIIAGEGGIRYTTCHQKRGGIMPTVGRRNASHPIGSDRVSSPEDAE